MASQRVWELPASWEALAEKAAAENAKFVDLLYAEFGVLYIRARLPASEKPVIDPLTRKMTAMLRKAVRPPFGFGGRYVCTCGAQSDSADRILPGDRVTNTLCVHYLAHHREEVPPEQLALVEALPEEDGEEPSIEELWPGKGYRY